MFQVNEEDIDFAMKLHCVDELAVRWWYALPPWPPADFDFDAALAKNGLRAFDLEKFKLVPEFDPRTGHKKVHPVECYPGVYRDLQGNMYDVRPKETAPSLVNFQRMPLSQLHTLLLKAYQEQLAALMSIQAENKQYDRQMEEQIQKSIKSKLTRLQQAM